MEPMANDNNVQLEITDLPNELLLLIFQRLPPGDPENLRATSKQMNHVFVTNEHLFPFKIIPTVSTLIVIPFLETREMIPQLNLTITRPDRLRKWFMVENANFSTFKRYLKIANTVTLVFDNFVPDFVHPQSPKYLQLKKHIKECAVEGFFIEFTGTGSPFPYTQQVVELFPATAVFVNKTSVHQLASESDYVISRLHTLQVRFSQSMPTYLLCRCLRNPNLHTIVCLTDEMIILDPFMMEWQMGIRKIDHWSISALNEPPLCCKPLSFKVIRRLMDDNKLRRCNTANEEFVRTVYLVENQLSVRKNKRLFKNRNANNDRFVR